MSKPKISVNKLGEYLTASPARRRRIVEDQRNPKAFVAARYSNAREEIVSFLASNMTDEEAMLNAAQKLRSEFGGTEFTENDRRASADAIEDFLEASENLNIDGLLVQPGQETSQRSMSISGVEITMRPDAILRDPDTEQVVGAIKLHFSKTTPLTKEGAEYVATALRVHLENVEENGKIDPKKCLVVDVPTGQVVNAPKAHKKKMNDITAACEEIDARWRKP